MRFTRETRNAISYFAQALVAGDFGPDGSRHSRDQLFLRDPGVVAQAVAIFLYRIGLDEAGHVLNHEEAEQRVRQFIRWRMEPSDLPEPAFTDDELGIC